MSNEIVFRTQLASIMEVLANAAVEEICKLVDDGYAVLHLQMSEYEKENEALKMRLHLMELNAVRSCAAEKPSPHYSDGALQLRDRPRGTAKDCPTVAGNGVPGDSGDICFPSLCPIGDESPAATFCLKQVETAEAQNPQSKVILIKEEDPEEYSDPHTDLKIPVQGAVDSGAGDEEGVPVLGLRASPTECSEELAEQDRTGNRTRVWEVSGLEAVLRLQAETTAVERLGDAGMSSGRGSDTFTGTEVQDHSPPFCVADSERRPAQSELRTVSDKLKGACVRLSSSSSDPAGLKTNVVVIDCVKEESVSLHSESDTEAPAPARPNVQHGRHRDNQKTAEAWPEHVNPSSLPRVWQTPFDAAGLNGIGARERQVGATSDFSAGRNDSSAKEKRFICRYCGKGFSRHNALEIHKRVHTGEKPFRCTQCGKRFSDSSNLRRHQSVHSRERPFSCTQCERSFSHHYQLKVHQRVHTGDKPFSCAHCGKRFGERGFLSMHLQRDHASVYGSFT